MHMKLLLIPSLLAFLCLMGAGCFHLDFPDPQLAKQEMDRKADADFALSEKATKEALAKKDLTLCEQAPTSTTVFSEFEIGGPVGSREELRTQCYFSYMRRYQEPAACAAIEKMYGIRDGYWVASYSNSWYCYRYLAEIAQQPTYCDRAPDIYEKQQCMTNVSRSTDACYLMPKGPQETAKYAFKVADCVRQVAIRQKNQDLCLTINGDDYGDGWFTTRNECLLQVASLKGLRSVSDLQPVCDLLIAENNTYEQDHIRECRSGNVMWYHVEDQIPSSDGL